MPQFELFDAVKLTQPMRLDDGDLAPPETPGAIVEVLGEGEAYLVELFGPWMQRNEKGDFLPALAGVAGAFQRTLDVVTLSAHEIALVSPALQTVGAEAQLLSIVEDLSQELVIEIVDFAQFLRHKQRQKAAVLAL